MRNGLLRQNGGNRIVSLLALAGVLNRLPLPSRRSVRWTTPHQGEQEKARRRRQIAKGMRTAFVPKSAA